MTTQNITVTLYEDNAGHLTMVCGNRAYTGFELLDEGADIIQDAKALAAGETSDWTLDDCSEDEDDRGEPVATITIAKGAAEIEFLAGPAGAAALRYVGSSADQERPEPRYAVVDEDIRELGHEAQAAGDTEQAELCRSALAGDEAARAECVEVIEAARAMRADEAPDATESEDDDGR
jgi:hypothetical protein